MFRVRCQCTKVLKLPNEMLGKPAACPQCERRLRVVAAQPADEQQLASAVLVIEDGPQRAGEQIFLAGSGTLTMGKAESAPLRLQGPSVSRRHGELLRTPRGWRVKDRGSTNGLFVNEQRVDTRDLRDGDLLTVGDFLLRFHRLADAPAPGRAGLPPGPAAEPADAGDSLRLLTDEELMEHTAIRPPSGIAAVPTRPAQTSAPAECPHCAAPLEPAARICVRCGTDLQTGKRLVAAAADRNTKSPPPGSLGAYLADCLQSFAFFLRPGDLARFLVISVVYILSGACKWLGFWGLFALIITLGLYCSFLFNTVAAAAGGEKDLPDLTMSGGWVEDLLAPIFKFLAAAALAGLPVIVFLIVVTILRGPDATADLDTDTRFISLVVLAAFLWPMVVLVLALGGVACLSRPDLILRTILRSYVPYLLTVVLTVLAIGITYFAESFLTSNPSYFGGHPLVISVVVDVVNVYFTIVAMRCIGLYYHHFKGRFAWSWG